MKELEPMDFIGWLVRGLAIALGFLIVDVLKWWFIAVGATTALGDFNSSMRSESIRSAAVVPRQIEEINARPRTVTKYVAPKRPEDCQQIGYFDKAQWERCTKGYSYEEEIK